MNARDRLKLLLIAVSAEEEKGFGLFECAQGPAQGLLIDPDRIGKKEEPDITGTECIPRGEPAPGLFIEENAARSVSRGVQDLKGVVGHMDHIPAGDRDGVGGPGHRVPGGHVDGAVGKLLQSAGVVKMIVGEGGFDGAAPCDAFDQLPQMSVLSRDSQVDDQDFTLIFDHIGAGRTVERAVRLFSRGMVPGGVMDMPEVGPQPGGGILKIFQCVRQDLVYRAAHWASTAASQAFMALSLIHI